MPEHEAQDGIRLSGQKESWRALIHLHSGDTIERMAVIDPEDDL